MVLRGEFIDEDYKVNLRCNDKVIGDSGESSAIGVVGQHPVCSGLG